MDQFRKTNTVTSDSLNGAVYSFKTEKFEQSIEYVKNKYGNAM